MRDIIQIITYSQVSKVILRKIFRVLINIEKENVWKFVR